MINSFQINQIQFIFALQQSDLQSRLDSLINFLDHGAVGLIGGISFSAFIALAARKRKIPLYSTHSRRVLIESELKIEELEITYKGAALKNLTITHIAFFNAGRAVIRSKDDVPNSGAFTLKTRNPDIEIVGHPVVTQVTTEFNNLSVN